MDNALATYMHTAWCAVNHTMQTSPGTLVLAQDMFIDVPVISNLIEIQDRRQPLINENLRRHNRKRYDYHHKVGELIMVKYYDPNKLEPRLHGSYIIVECRTNSTVVVQMDDIGNVYETFNIRKIVPYKRTVVALYNEEENYFIKVEKVDLGSHYCLRHNDDKNHYYVESYYDERK